MFPLSLDQSDISTAKDSNFFPPCNLITTDAEGSEQNQALMLGCPIEQFSPRNRVISMDSDCQQTDVLLALHTLDDGTNLSDLRLFPYTASLFEPAGVHCVQRRYSECGELCRSRLSDSKRSFKRSFSTSKLQRIRKMPIRRDLVFGDVYSCDSDQECFYIFSKRRSDLISGTA